MSFDTMVSIGESKQTTIDCTWNATLCCSSRPKGAYGGALSAVRAQCGHSAIIWASSRTGDPYFVILGGIIVAPNVGFDASSTLGIWHFWIFTHFHPFCPL